MGAESASGSVTDTLGGIGRATCPGPCTHGCTGRTTRDLPFRPLATERRADDYFAAVAFAGAGRAGTRERGGG